MSIRRAIAAISVFVAAAACGTDGGEPASAPATSVITTPPASVSEAATNPAPADGPIAGAPDFPENTADQTAKNSGEWDLVLTDVRVAEHEGFDRIVLEFTGTGVPGWTVNYVTKAVLDGSGEVVTLDGDSILDIYASGTTWPGPEGDYYSGAQQFEPDNGGDVDDVHVAGTFEGYTQVLAGIAGDRVPFRVFALTDPSRLVVDVVDESAD